MRHGLQQKRLLLEDVLDLLLDLLDPDVGEQLPRVPLPVVHDGGLRRGEPVVVRVVREEGKAEVAHHREGREGAALEERFGVL